MSIEHKNITDPNIHEPKGAAAASVGQVYVSNGAGSGTWKRLGGWAKYADSTYTSGSPLAVTGGATVTLPNNGAGAGTNTSNLSGAFDTSTYELLPTTVGVFYECHVSFSASYSGSGHAHIDVAIDTGTVVSAAVLSLPKAASSSHTVSVTLPVQVDAAFNSNGAIIEVTPSNNTNIWGISLVISKIFSPV